MKADERGFWISSGASPLCAFWHLPGRPRAVALLCNAFAEERKGCLKPMVDLARRLAGLGVAVLRFDYAGCGDSPGVFGEGGTAAWEDDLLRAARLLADAFPGLPRLWSGARGGAVLALSAAARADDAVAPDAFLLWEPVDGAAFLRQTLQRAMVNAMIAYGKSRAGRDELEAAWQRGEAVDLDGYRFPASLANGLRALVPSASTRPGLLLRLSSDARAAAACRGACPRLEEVFLRTPPFWNTVGQVDASAVFDASLSWVREWLGAAAAPAGFTPAVPPAGTVAADADGTLWEHVAVEGPDGTVRGILHRPEAGKNGAPFSGAVLMLHGWSGDKTGPHALFTAAAKRLAARRFACLRIDFGGRGSSDGLASEASIERMTAEARAALRFLRERTGSVPVSVIALCSGCKVAISLAADEPSLPRLVLWSAESMGSLRSGSTGWRKTLAALRAYLRKLGRPETWKKILRRQVKAGMVGKALAAHETRSPEEARREDATLRRFRRFGGRLFFVYGGSDPDAPGSSKAYAAFCRKHRIPADRHLIPHAGHSYYGAEWKDELLGQTIAWLADESP
ncbi:MAG: alpha/beta fold hydrolase [Kiritimatiellia bacterium]|jgi:alpha/beta superfamily hydrolase